MNEETNKKDKNGKEVIAAKRTSRSIKDNAGGGSEFGGTIKEQSSTIPKDPLVSIGCKQPGGILIQLPPRRSFLLQNGFNKLNKSLWEMIVASGDYAELVYSGTIFLSKNEC